jgi:hypothetical protein
VLPGALYKNVIHDSYPVFTQAYSLSEKASHFNEPAGLRGFSSFSCFLSKRQPAVTKSILGKNDDGRPGPVRRFFLKASTEGYIAVRAFLC